MVDKIQKEEITLQKKDDFINYYDNREVEYYSIPSSQISLGSANNLSLDGQTYTLTRTGMDSLLKETRIPEDYGYNVCDSELLKFSTNHILAGLNKFLTIKVVNSKVSLVSSNTNKLIDDKLVVDSVSDIISELHLVEKTDGFLRITFLKDFEKEITAGDILKGGYEILNYENKPNGLSISLFFLRLVCVNGMISSEPVEKYRFSSGKNNGISDILYNLRSRISQYQDVLKYSSAFSFTLNNKVDNHLEFLRYHLKKFSGKDFYNDNFSDFKKETPWFDVINRITNSAKLNGIERKRDFELMAGDLSESFFHKEDYGKHLFKKNLCRTCSLLN